MKRENFNLELFKSLREEINLRISIHYRTLAIKYSLTGVIFTFLISDNKIQVSAFTVSALFAFLFDVLMLENLGWIRSTGDFIKRNIEGNMAIIDEVVKDEKEIIKWETDQTQRPGTPWACFSVKGYILGVWGIGAVLLAGFFVELLFIQEEIFRTDNVVVVNWFLFAAAFFAASYTFNLVFVQLADTSYREWLCGKIFGVDDIGKKEGRENS